MDNLKPCPFCGKEGTALIETVQSCEECKNFEDEDLCPAYEPFDDTPDKCPFKAVVCVVYKGGCGASAGWRNSIEKAIEAWNNRIQEDL